MRSRRELPSDEELQVREAFDAIVDAALSRAEEAGMLYSFGNTPQNPDATEDTAYFLQPESGYETTITSYPLTHTNPRNPLARLVAGSPLSPGSLVLSRALAASNGKKLTMYQQSDELELHRNPCFNIGEGVVSRTARHFVPRPRPHVEVWGPIIARSKELRKLSLMLANSEPVAMLPTHLIELDTSIDT
jgi:hypothetical protein